MENLPVEVLEIIFHSLSKKEDMENCFNINSKWRHIIENMFSKKSKLTSLIMHKGVTNGTQDRQCTIQDWGKIDNQT